MQSECFILWVYRKSIKRRRTRKLEHEKPELDGDAILPVSAQELSAERGRVEMGGAAIHEMGHYDLAFELDATERKEEQPRYSNDVADRPWSSNSLEVLPLETELYSWTKSSAGPRELCGHTKQLPNLVPDTLDHFWNHHAR